MGQRQDKDEIVYGNDCRAGFPLGETPKYVYVRFSGILACPLAAKVPPNDRVFKLTQHDTASCRWLYTGTGWFCGLQSFTPFADYSLDLATSPEGMGYFNAVHAMPFEEGLVFTNSIEDCLGDHMGHHGIAIVTWRIETLNVMGLLNIKTQEDLFMEMRPLADGNRVYKYCDLKDATNVAILCLPGKEYGVTGTLTPDGTGSYYKHVLHNGKMSYRRTDGLYFLWWDGATRWVINTALDRLFPPAWLRVDPNPVGAYQPIGDWLGVATVAEL